MKHTLSIATAVLVLSATAANAADCPSMYASSQVGWKKWSRFFSGTSFGTVGFAPDSTGTIYVPRPDVTCVTLPRTKAHLYIVFNHRAADFDGVGYVSFKLYGLTQGAPQSRARMLSRKGGWHRDANTALPDDLAAHNGLPSPDASVIAKYEAFYGLNSSGDIAAFDQVFGRLHGVPNGSTKSSWSDRAGMQPGSLDLSKVGWLRHELQRVEVSAKTSTPGDPPMIETHQLQYGSILVSVASPLGEATQRTILFKFN